MSIYMYDAENNKFKFSQLRRHFKALIIRFVQKHIDYEAVMYYTNGHFAKSTSLLCMAVGSILWNILMELFYGIFF